MVKPIIIAVVNNKGGTGKTTITFNTAAGLHRKGYNVLMIDLDSQANLTMATGFKVTNHVGHLITGDFEWQDVIISGTHDTDHRLDLIPPAPTLLLSEAIINADPLLLTELRVLLQSRTEYDFVLIDCPPSLGSLTKNDLVAANYYVVPIQGENFAY